MFTRFLSPLKNRRVLWMSVGCMFFQFLIILGQFLAAYVVAKLVEGTISRSTFESTLPIAYAGLGFFACLFGYLFFHTRHTTSSILKGEMMQVIRGYSVQKFITSRSHRDGIIPTGKTIALFQEGMKSWMDTLVLFFSDFLPSIICLVGGLIFIAFADLKVFLAVVPYLLVTSAIIIWARSRAAPFIRNRKTLNTQLTRALVRTILEKQIIQLSRKWALELQKYEASWLEYIQNIHGSDIYNAFSWWFSSIAIDVFRISAVIYLGYMILQGQASPGQLVIVGTVFMVISRYYNSILESFQTFQENFIHIEELWKYLDALIPFTGYSEGKTFTPKSTGIEFQNMSFAYPNGESIFEDFSLAIKPWVTTAIVGRSGAGKSTLVKLILGLLPPNSGKILVDGQDLSVTALETYYREVAYLPQEPAIFDGTIRENLTYALGSTPPDIELESALRKAECDFALRFSGGLNTEIGERGIRLSGGERQRLAIARILLQDPEIILLDEPTAALDSFSEEAVTRALHATFPGKTVIIIAHRLQTVKEASTIIVLGKNTILEQGTHAELTAKNGHYASMVDLQSGRIIEEAEEI